MSQILHVSYDVLYTFFYVMKNADLIRASRDDLLEDAAIIDFLIKDYQKN